MTDTDNEIIKALECWINDFDGKATEFVLLCNTLNLIIRQKAEIERYEKENDVEFSKFEILDKSVKEHYKGLYEDAKEFVRVKAIKEFAEKLKEKPIKCELPLFGLRTKDEIEEHFNNIMMQVCEAIDNLVNEMVGEENA